MFLDPVAFCVERLPELFSTLKAATVVRAQAGELVAQKRLADVNGASATARIVFTGEPGGEVFVVAERGELRVLRELPAEPAVRYALVMPSLAARQLADTLATRAQAALPRDPLPGFASARADKLFSTYRYAFDVQIAGAPVASDVSGGDLLCVRLSLGRDLPAAPDFTVHAAYADLAEARARGAGMPELVAGGKIRVTGDTAKAMMFAMTLAQLR
jgi:SCP-2 sterol transfer family